MLKKCWENVRGCQEDAQGWQGHHIHHKFTCFIGSFQIRMKSIIL
jgi:hypothetical protein